jgi:hypothetical protein
MLLLLVALWDRWSIDDAYDDAMMGRIDPKDK